jgi:hypothetical protein
MIRNGKMTGTQSGGTNLNQGLIVKRNFVFDHFDGNFLLPKRIEGFQHLKFDKLLSIGMP